MRIGHEGAFVAFLVDEAGGAIVKGEARRVVQGVVPDPDGIAEG